MAKFKCNECGAVYEDYYPVDDSCLKSKKGHIWIIKEIVNYPDS